MHALRTHHVRMCAAAVDIYTCVSVQEYNVGETYVLAYICIYMCVYTYVLGKYLWRVTRTPFRCNKIEIL